MFKRQIEAIVKSMKVEAKDQEGRVATCKFDIAGIDRPTAMEAHPLIGRQLYRLNDGGGDWKNTEREYVRSEGIGKLLFDKADVQFDFQQMEFRAEKGTRIPGAVLKDVEIASVEARRAGDAYTLGMQVEFRFTVEQASVVAKLLIEQLGQSVWLTFKAMQRELVEADGEQGIGEFVNERNKVTRMGGR